MIPEQSAVEDYRSNLSEDLRRSRPCRRNEGQYVLASQGGLAAYWCNAVGVLVGYAHGTKDDSPETVEEKQLLKGPVKAMEPHSTIS